MNLYKVICEYSDTYEEVTIFVLESTKSGAIKAYLYKTKTKKLERLTKIYVYEICKQEEIINGASL